MNTLHWLQHLARHAYDHWVGFLLAVYIPPVWSAETTENLIYEVMIRLMVRRLARV